MVTIYTMCMVTIYTMCMVTIYTMSTTGNWDSSFNPTMKSITMRKY